MTGFVIANAISLPVDCCIFKGICDKDLRNETNLGTRARDCSKRKDLLDQYRLRCGHFYYSHPGNL